MLRKGCILVVETDEGIRHLFERWLTDAGYEVRIATSGIAAASAAPFDLIILDVPQPRDTVSRIRALRLDGRVPVLAVSARFRRGVAASAGIAKRLGVRTVLAKPFAQSELLSAVESALRQP